MICRRDIQLAPIKYIDFLYEIVKQIIEIVNVNNTKACKPFLSFCSKI